MTLVVVPVLAEGTLVAAPVVAVPVASGAPVPAGEQRTVSSRGAANEALLRGLAPGRGTVGWTLHDLRVGEDSLLRPGSRPLVDGRWLQLGRPTPAHPRPGQARPGFEVDLLPWEDDRCLPLGVLVNAGVPVSLVVSVESWAVRPGSRGAELRLALLVDLPPWDPSRRRASPASQAGAPRRRRRTTELVLDDPSAPTSPGG